MCGSNCRPMSSGEKTTGRAGASNLSRGLRVPLGVDGGDAEPQRIPDGKGVYSFTVKAKRGVREVGIKSLRFGEGPIFVKKFTVSPK